jgi:hypothetical protein
VDDARFDFLTRSLTLRLSRRRSLGLLATLSLPALAAPGTAAAKKKKPCPPCTKRKHGKCKGTLPDGADCAGGTCQGGRCAARNPGSPSQLATCPDGQRLCRDACLSAPICCDSGDCSGGKTCQAGSCDCPIHTTLCVDQTCRQCCTDADCRSALVGGGLGACSDGVCICPIATRYCLEYAGVRACGACCVQSDCTGGQYCDSPSPNLPFFCSCGTGATLCTVGSRDLCTPDTAECIQECGARCTATKTCGCPGLVCENNIDGHAYCVPAG